MRDTCSGLARCTEVEESEEFNWLDPSWTRQEVPCCYLIVSRKGLEPSEQAMIYWIIIYVSLRLDLSGSC